MDTKENKNKGADQVSETSEITKAEGRAGASEQANDKCANFENTNAQFSSEGVQTATDVGSTAQNDAGTATQAGANNADNLNFSDVGETELSGAGVSEVAQQGAQAQSVVEPLDNRGQGAEQKVCEGAAQEGETQSGGSDAKVAGKLETQSGSKNACKCCACNKKEKTERKSNWLVRLWKYYSPYEKIWLFSICSVGILLGILFPEDAGQPNWLRVIEILVIVGGCSCELLLSKQSRWAFIVSFVLYDTTQTIVYFANGLYISALFEIIFWIPILFVSFYQWTKQADAKNATLTVVKNVNYARDLAIFVGVLIVSVVTGLLFTTIGALAESMPDWWYLDALANTFSVCNGLFLVFRFKEQWLPWIGVALVEAVMWILSGQYIMLVLSVGYLMNSLYGLLKWQKYIKTHPEE